MEGYSNSIPFSSQEVLDVKPIRTIAPMRPPSLGLSSIAPSTDAPPFVSVTPFGSFSSSSESGYPPNFVPMFPTFASPQASNKKPVDATPLNSRSANGFFHGEQLDFSGGSASASASVRKSRQPISSVSYGAGSSDSKGSDEKKAKPHKKPRKVYNNHDGLLPPSHDSREAVEVILMTFDGLRRRVQQLDEVKDGSKRADLKVGPIMTSNELRVNMGKRIGSVPGVEVGDMFYFRFEMCLIGLHSQIMAGIDTMTASFENVDDTVAVCIVSAGVYDNEDEDVDAIIYSGQGGSGKDDQKLERGNLALERSLHRANEIRVVRSAKDFTCQNGKIYVYDGIYKVHESWVEKGKSGFNVFKFKLLRESGQPDGISVWRRTQKWIDNPSSRGRAILTDISSGVENLPVCLVNDVDVAKAPSHFTYATRVKYSTPISFVKLLHRCTCQSVCLPGDKNCPCAQQNDGDLPYSSNGLLVSRKPLIYECSSSCPCSANCRNRVTQKGIRLNFEVFRTRDRGWGLRSWHPIRAGTFICEYTGEVIDKSKADEISEENEFIFWGLSDEKTLKWNYIPELLGEPSGVQSSEAPKPLSFAINAKNMGNIARFMNHSCSPNVFWQPVQYDHSDEERPHIMFFAIKHIPPMTELTYDYGLSTSEIGRDMNHGAGSGRTKKCLCGSSKCRGLFG